MSAAAPGQPACQCPKRDGRIYHQRETCTDPVVARLGWYADKQAQPAAAPGQARAYCCEACDDPDPRWNLTRRGDVVTTWACDAHLAQAADGLQRDREVTELIITDARKAREWAGITRSLNAIAEDV